MSASNQYLAHMRAAEVGRLMRPPSVASTLAGLSSRDEYGFWNLTPAGAPIAVPPFALAFSTVAMDGHALAAGDEEGIVTVLDTRRNLRDQMHTPSHPRFTAHDNAIFDLAWLRGDAALATASGDATIRVFDVATSTRCALLRGHTGSAKCVRPSPDTPHVLLTGARDGNILAFDLRVPAEGIGAWERYHAPVLTIARPHTRVVRYSMTTGGLGRKRRRVQADGPPTARVGSVTSLAFSVNNSNQLFSAGASDGAVKLWDLRLLRRSSGRGEAEAEGGIKGFGGSGGIKEEGDTPIASVVPGEEFRRDKPFKTGRPHGIANIDVDPTGRRLLVSSTDSSIYLYNTQSLHLGYERVLTGHSQTSFYIRARFSPDGNFVLSGSADSKAFMWDVCHGRSRDGALQPFLELPGHRGGEASAVDWCRADLFKVATCADDSTTKVWTLDGRGRSGCGGSGEAERNREERMERDVEEGRGRAGDREVEDEGAPAVLRARRPQVRRKEAKRVPEGGRRPSGAVGANGTKMYRSQDIRRFFHTSTNAPTMEGLYSSSR